MEKQKLKVLFRKYGKKTRKEGKNLLKWKIRTRGYWKAREKHLRWSRLYGTPSKMVYRRWPGRFVVR